VIRRTVVVTRAARSDLAAVYDHIAAEVSHRVARAYVQRVEAWLATFDIAAERGTLRDDLQPGLRTIGFERRVTAAFTVEDARVVILRLFSGGQDWGAVLDEG
jgi:toxin ParE1/3/4